MLLMLACYTDDDVTAAAPVPKVVAVESATREPYQVIAPNVLHLRALLPDCFQRVAACSVNTDLPNVARNLQGLPETSMLLGPGDYTLDSETALGQRRLTIRVFNVTELQVQDAHVAPSEVVFVVPTVTFDRAAPRYGSKLPSYADLTCGAASRNVAIAIPLVDEMGIGVFGISAGKTTFDVMCNGVTVAFPVIVGPEFALPVVAPQPR